MRMKMQKRGYEAWGDVQRQLQESGLAGRLKGYEAQEEMQKRLLKAGYSRDVTKMILGVITQGVKGFGGRPGVEALRRIRELGYGEVPGIAEEIPGQYVATMDPYATVMPALGRRLEAGEYPSKEEMTVLTRLLGSDKPQEFLGQAERARTGVAERGLRRGELDLARAEAGLKVGKLTKKQLEDKLKFFSKKEKVFSDELKSLEEEMDLMEGDPKYDDKNKQIAEMRQNQVNVLDQLLGELDKKKADKILAKLRTGGATIEALEKHKEQFMKKENLTEAEYNYIRLNL